MPTPIAWSVSQAGKAAPLASAGLMALAVRPPMPAVQVALGGHICVLGNQGMMDVPFSFTSYTEETIRNQYALRVEYGVWGAGQHCTTPH